MSGDGADLDVSKQALGLIAKGITDSLAELKELGSVAGECVRWCSRGTPSPRTWACPRV